MGYEMTSEFGYMGGWGMIFAGLMMVFWIGVLVALIVFLLKWIGGGPKEGSPRDGAAAILKQRYAGGEIDTSEYEERLKGLRSAG